MKEIDLANTLGALSLAIVDGFHTEISAITELQSIDAAALNVIGFRPNISIRLLSELMNLTHPGAVRCVDRLVSAKLVKRLPGQDARTLALQLTELGQDSWQLLSEARMTWLNKLVAELPIKKRLAFSEGVSVLLKKLARNHVVGERICRLCDESSCVPSRCPITDEAVQFIST
jgi:MarR family transcriptional regulator, negative regulator of the multidrug operon emrRAB